MPEITDALIIQAHRKALEKGYITRAQYRRLKHKNGRVIDDLDAPVEIFIDEGKVFIHGNCAYPLQYSLDDLLADNND